MFLSESVFDFFLAFDYILNMDDLLLYSSPSKKMFNPIDLDDDVDTKMERFWTEEE